MFGSLSAALSLFLWAYPWPLAPMNQQHNVSGVFCEFREGPPPHFHSGVDIPAVEGTPVYAVDSGNVLWLGSGSNGGVRVGRFAYVHVVPRADLEIGDYVEQGEIVGYINPLNHVHFKDGGGASSYVNRNPLIPPGLEPFVDPYRPEISQVSFYTDGLENPIDPQHLSGPIDVVALAMDTTDYGPWDTNNGIYRIGFALYRGDSVVIEPHTRFQFDTKPDNAYTLNVYAPWSTNGSHYYIITNQLESNDALNFQLLGDGDYTLVIFAFDTEGNSDTATLSIHAEPPDTVAPDPPRPFRLHVLADGRAEFLWHSSLASDVAHYKVFLRFNDAPWTLWATVGPQDSSYVTQYPLPDGWNFAFRILAEDGAIPANVSDTSIAYVVRRGFPIKTLLVDGAQTPDFGILYWRLLEGMPSGNVLTDASGVPHDPDADLVLLSWGNSPQGFEETEWSLIAQSMDLSHNVVLTGSRIAATLTGSPSDSVLVDSLFGGVATLANAQPLIWVQGLPGTPFEGWSGFLDDGTYGAYRVDTVSVLTTTRLDAQPVLEYPGLGLAGIQTSATLLLGFPWEVLEPDSAREALLQRIAEWASVQIHEVGSQTPSSAPVQVRRLASGQLQLRTSFKAPVQIWIFDIAGRERVSKRFEGQVLLPTFPGGVYFLRWQVAQQEGIRKLWIGP